MIVPTAQPTLPPLVPLSITGGHLEALQPRRPWRTRWIWSGSGGCSSNKLKVPCLSLHCPARWLLSSGGHGQEKLRFGMFPWWMAGWRSGSTGFCLNKLVVRGPPDLVDLGGGDCGPSSIVLPSPARRGDDGEKGVVARWRSWLTLQQGRSFYFSREVSNADEDVVGVLDSRTATTPSSCVGDGFPRPARDGHHQPPGQEVEAEALASSAVCSPVIVPSGFVPGDDDGDCAAASSCGGEGAGLDCVSYFHLEVLCANCRDLVVFFFFFQSLNVKCNSAAEV